MTDERRQETALDLPRLLRILDAHKVEYVIVGGIAATAHGSPSFTDDLDICYQRSKPNTRALARALHDLSAILHDGTQIITRDILPRALELGTSSSSGPRPANSIAWPLPTVRPDSMT